MDGSAANAKPAELTNARKACPTTSEVADVAASLVLAVVEDVA